MAPYGMTHCAKPDTVRCPLHHACFSLRTGEALRAPAFDPLPRWRVEIAGDKAFVREKLSGGPPLPTPGTSPESILIIGGGAAGSAAADMIRREGYEGPVTIYSYVFVANDVDCYAAACGLLGAADTRAQLGSINMRTAVVVGEEDYATPVAMARQLHEAIPQSTLTIIPGARHLTPIEFPDHITTELRGLFERI